MDCAKKSLLFVVDEHLSFLVKKYQEHVNQLFGVTVGLENTQQRKRWIRLQGNEEQISKAKEYILALTHPEMSTSLENVLGNPLFTKLKQAEIEKISSAVLSRCDDQSNQKLQIQGTSFSVAVAKSLIDELSCPSPIDVPGDQSLKGPVVFSNVEDQEGWELVDDCIIVDDVVAVDPKSTSLAEPQVDKLNKRFTDRLGTVLKSLKPKDKSKTGEVSNPCNLKDGDTASSLSPHGREQQAYLRQTALALNHEKEVVEEALLKFDMNDIILPAIFIEVVEKISREKAKTSQQCLSPIANEITSVQDLDVSVICMDSSDEETYVMRPFGHVDEPKRQADPDKTIVLSSDDEDNERPQEIKSNQFKQCNRSPERSNYQKHFGLHVAKVPPVPVIGSSANEGNSTASKPEVPDADMDCSASGVNTEQFDQMHLRQEYVDGLLRASPKGPRRGRRHIVIDASNVAMCHGNHVQYSILGIEICIKYFLSRGHNEITAFVPEWRRYGNQTSPQGRAQLEKLNKAGFVKFTPARRVGNQTIASYDDRFILNLAVEEEGIIVSNDQYRDLVGERACYQDVVLHRLLQFTFVGNHFMPPDDPLGRFGPSLDQFLQHPEQPKRPAMAAMEASSAPPRTCHDGAIPKVNQGEPTTNPPQAVRSEADTEKLFYELTQVFPEPNQVTLVRKVLDNHKLEVDLNRLSLLCINAMSIT
ncbi:hypothetical protein EGW08_021039 [Elysia chlorotica]|uniref:Uncharacterized protein n=1 Tax=Elysia chlorotica TaxID=188477 RepID=A0A433SPM2_ELYCH|nr:hypothetical protein EGW08_021039 [Elysia chlorotica]